MKLQLIKKNDFEKLIAVCWITLFVLWGYVAISGNYFEIVVANPTIIKICDFIDNSWLLTKIIKFITYYLNWIFVVHAIFQKRLLKYKPLLISVMIFAFWLIKTTFVYIPIINYIDFIYFGIIAIMCRSKWYRSVIGCILVFVFAFISSFIKQVFIPNVNFNEVSSLIALCLYIDVYLMSFIYYLTEIYRKEFNYGRLVYILQVAKEVENRFSSIGNSFISIFRRNRSVASLKEKAFDFYCGLIFTLITYLSLLIVGIIFNRWIEITVCVVAFHLFRGSEKETYHASDDVKCWCVSMLSFIVIMKLTLPIYISYIVSIALAFGLCMIMRCIYFIRKMIAKGKHNSKRKKLIEIIGEDNINEEYIEDLCTKKGLNYKYSETVYLYLTNTLEETALILDTNNSTVTRRLNRFIELYS